MDGGKANILKEVRQQLYHKYGPVASNLINNEVLRLGNHAKITTDQIDAMDKRIEAKLEQGGLSATSPSKARAPSNNVSTSQMLQDSGVLKKTGNKVLNRTLGTEVRDLKTLNKNISLESHNEYNPKQHMKMTNSVINSRKNLFHDDGTRTPKKITSPQKELVSVWDMMRLQDQKKWQIEQINKKLENKNHHT